MKTPAVYKYPYCSIWESQGTTAIARLLRIESTDSCLNFISAESLQLDFQQGARVEEV